MGQFYLRLIQSWLGRQRCGPALVMGLSAGMVLTGGAATAQIVPDDTLGDERSQLTPNVTVEGDLGDRIDGGAIRGSNLFHSFEAFSVRELERVYFASPAGIDTILSRVTGSDVSEIFGTLGVEGQASLFFLNPNGIVFGDNAVLDIRGSFVATTADRFTFPDGSTYSAVNPEAPPLLTVNVEPGLQYGANPGAIANQGNLSVGRDLTLAAGRLTHTGALTAEFGRLTLEASDGSIEIFGGNLESLRQMTVQATEAIDISDGAIATGDRLLVASDQSIDVANSIVTAESDLVWRSPIRRLGEANTYTTGGYFITEAADGTVVDFLIPHPQVILADGDVQLEANYTGPSLYVLAGGSFSTAAAATEIFIVSGAGGAVTQTIADGAGGTQEVTVGASLQPTLDIRTGVDWNELLGALPGNDNTTAAIATFGTAADPSGATSADLDLADTDVGLFGVVADQFGRVALSNQFRPNEALVGDLLVNSIDTTSIFGAGSVTLQSRNRAIVDGSINVSPLANFLDIFLFDGVNGGDVSIAAAGDIQFQPGSTVESIGFLGGEIELVSRQGDIVIADAFIGSASTDTGERGDRVPGNISLEAQSVLINNLGNVAIAAVVGEQVGGGLSVSASDSVEIVSNDNPGTVVAINPIINTVIDIFNGTGLASATLGDASAGAITLSTGQLRIQNAGQVSDPNVPLVLDEGDLTQLTGISSATVNASPLFGFGGNAGDIRIVADAITLDGNQPGEFLPPTQADRANLVRAINTGITAASQGSGLTGNISIEVGQLVIQDGAAITGGSVASAALEAPENPDNTGSIVITVDDVMRLSGKAAIATSTLSQAEAGDLTLQISASGQGLFLQDGAIISADTLILEDDIAAGITSGAAGNVSISAPVIELVNNSRIGSASGANGGSPGTIAIEVDSLQVINSLISTSSENNIQTAGNLIVEAAEGISLSGSVEDELQANRPGGLLAEATLEGNAGFIAVSTPQLQIGLDGAILTSTNSGVGGNIEISELDLATLDNGEISASTRTGIAGSVSLSSGQQAGDRLSLSGSTSLLAAQATAAGGRAGGIDLNMSQIAVEDGAAISASNVSSPVGGNIQFRGVDTLEVVEGQVTAATVAGVAGNITLNSALNGNVGADGGLNGALGRANAALDEAIAREVMLTDGSIQTEATATGEAGSIVFNTQALVMENGAEILATTNSGRGGDIVLSGLGTAQLNDSSISTSSVSGRGGDIGLSGTFAVELDDSSILASSQSGRGGDISLAGVTSLQLDTSSISASSELERGGDIRFSGQFEVQLNDSDVAASSPSGQGGDIVFNGITTAQLADTTISASTESGSAGQLRLQASGTIELSDSRLLVEANGPLGRAGNLTVVAPALELTSNSEILASTVDGAGGDITLRGLETLAVDNSRISAETQTGTAGSLTISASDQVRLTDGSALSVEAQGNSGPSPQNGRVPTAGSLTLRTNQLSIEDQSSISVSSLAGLAGNLTLQARQVQLFNQSSITAETGASGDESTANIDLTASDLLLLRNNSEISATANGDANGGNITIDNSNGFIFAVSTENSDIFANADRGQGGNIDITTEGLFGIAVRERRTPLSDITASSETGIDGTIIVRQPDVDPSRGLVDLPSQLISADDRLKQDVCRASRDSSFTIVGRGGIPPTPDELFGSDDLWQDQRLTFVDEAMAESQTATSEARWDTVRGDRLSQDSLRSEALSEPSSIIEAQDWLRDEQGNVVLIAEAVDGSPRRQRALFPPCHQRSLPSSTDRD